MTDAEAASMATMGAVMAAISGGDPTGYDVRAKLADLLQEGLSEQAMGRIKKQFKAMADEIEADLDYGIKENLASNLADFVCNMANKAVEELLAGNEERMRQYLSCREYGYTGRDTDHRVIHGVLSEHDPLTLRKKIVDAFPKLLKTERILDLEDQVRSLVKTINALEADKRRLGDELRGLR